MKGAGSLIVGLFAILGVLVVVYAILGFHPAYHGGGQAEAEAEV